MYFRTSLNCVMFAIYSLVYLAIDSTKAFSQAAPPRIEVVGDTYDFGTIPEGQKVIHDFEVKNTGGSDLVIHQVVPACGCTAAVAEQSTVSPGGTTRVHLEFDSLGFSGEKTKSARINSNDPEHPSVFVTVKGIVEHTLSVSPSIIQLGDFVQSLDSPLPQVSVDISARSPTTIGKIAPGSPAVRVSEVSRSSNQVKILVEPTRDAALGELRDRVVVEIERSDGLRQVSIPIIGRYIGPITLKPSSVAFGIIEGSEPVERRVQIENRRKVPLRIASITSDIEAVTAREIPVDNHKGGVLVVTLDPKKLKGDLRGVVTLTFDDKSVAPLSFSVYGVRPPAVSRASNSK